MSTTVDVSFVLNGVRQRVETSANALLLDVLRSRFGLTGVKASCERGVCGSCTCLVDGEPVAACSTFMFDVEGTVVETVEGFAADGELSAVQQAFVERSGFQCGYCTPGMITLTTALLRERPQPSRDEIVSWLGSNVCRCTGYLAIIEAVEHAVELAGQRDAR